MSGVLAVHQRIPPLIGNEWLSGQRVAYDASRTIFMRIAGMFGFLACLGMAQGVQNMELSWTVGGVTSSSSTVPGTTTVLSGSAGFVTQIGYAYQLPKPQAGFLWLELPLTFAWQGAGSISGSTVTSIDRNAWYLTPGVRLKSPTYGRVSFYGVLGGGLGAFNKIQSTVSGTEGSVNEQWVLHLVPVADFAGGIDLRLSRLLSLRAEGRDFVSGANLGGVSGHNHPAFLVGLGFHL